MWPKELGFIARLAVWEFRDVDDDLIHRDPPQEWAKGAIEEHLGALSGECAWVAVAIAEAQDGRFGVAREQGASIGNAVAFGEVVDNRDARLERHHGFEYLLIARDGREAVEKETGANHGGGAAFESKEAGGVTEVNVEGAGRSGNALDEGIKERELRAREFRVLVGHREV